MGYGPTAVVVASAPGMLRGELGGGGGPTVCPAVFPWHCDSHGEKTLI